MFIWWSGLSLSHGRLFYHVERSLQTCLLSLTLPQDPGNKLRPLGRSIPRWTTFISYHGFITCTLHEEGSDAVDWSNVISCENVLKNYNQPSPVLYSVRTESRLWIINLKRERLQYIIHGARTANLKWCAICILNDTFVCNAFECWWIVFISYKYWRPAHA